MEKENSFVYIITVVMIMLLVLVAFQTYQISMLSSEMKSLKITGITGLATESVISGTSTLSSIDVIPKGVPAIYGSELGVSFDDISPSNPTKTDQTIEKIAVLDDQIQLTDDLLQRYISIAGSISCEYCCGVSSIIFTTDTSNYKAGDAACGCAHSYAMRGLAKYLLKNHANEYTNEQILEELGKWKTLFFPSQMTQKAGVLQQNGIELNYINLASNKYRGIEQ